MKKFNDYLELVFEAKGSSGRSTMRRGNVKKDSSSSFTGSSEVQTITNRTGKILYGANEKINNAYQKFRNSVISYDLEIAPNQFIDFKYFNDYYKEYYSEKKDKDIKNIIKDNNDIYSLYKEFFNKEADDNNPSYTYEILSALNQVIKIIDTKKDIRTKDINIANSIYNKIVNNDVKLVVSEFLPEITEFKPTIS